MNEETWEQASAEAHGLLSALEGRLAPLADVPESHWRQRPQDGKWTALETLAHLRAADAISAPRLLQVLARDEPPLPEFDERRWQRIAGYETFSPITLLDGLRMYRCELLQALAHIRAADWMRSGRHEARGG